MTTDHSITTIVYTLINLLYFLLLAGIYLGLRRLRYAHPSTAFSVSIVIAARNEEDSIDNCMQSLAELDYPEDRFEVVIVDDHSQDRTPEKIAAFCASRKNWKYILLQEKSQELRGKKNALLHGINQSVNELIFTTDADCTVPSSWLKDMVGYFQPEVSMVLGYSPLEKGKGFLYRLLQFDNLFSAIVSAAPTQLGYPFTSVGRNLAYRKQAYNDAGGFLALKKFRSGDDVHLTERFRYLNTGKINFCANPKTFVTTRLLRQKRDILQQQIRKNSKALQTSKSSVAISVLIFLYYVLLLVFPLAMPAAIQLWIIVLGLKFVLEFIALQRAARIFDQGDLIPYLPLMQIIYPFLITLFSLIGVFQLYRWKK